jgi:rSAM/selenodomain-associated transferase 1
MRMRSIVVMAKEPRAGAVKTRLAAVVGSENAARLAEAFLRDTVSVASELIDRDTELVLCHTPREAAPWFAELEPRAHLLAQIEGDLGARMAAAFASCFERGAERVLMVGSDAPHTESSTLRDAFAQLDGAALVLAPSLDGGYCAIGLRAECPQLFERIEWSTARVLEQTRRRAAQVGLSVRELAASFDVDDADALSRLRDHISVMPPRACPHTRAALSLAFRAASGVDRAPQRG